MRRKLAMFAILVLSLLMITQTAFAGSELKSSIVKGFGPVKAAVPYLNTVNYFGYIAKDTKPDGKFKGKDAFYIYVWVPVIIDEIGISMYSPADMEPAKGDFKHPLFDKDMARDPKRFFDTFIALERMAIIEPEKIKDGGKPFSMLAENDDSGEMHPLPSGSKYNSLLRHVSTPKDPLKALVRGVYRITFTSFRGNVEGSFIATVGTNIPGVIIAPTLQDLHKLVAEQK